MSNFQERVNFIWSVADLLRGDYKASQYGQVILPLTVLRRLDCVLEPTKDAVLQKIPHRPSAADGTMRGMLLNLAAGQSFHNVSRFTFARLLTDADGIAANLRAYLNGFSRNIRDMFLESFRVQEQLDQLQKADLLYLVVKRFAEMDLHPNAVDNHEMGLIFEELIHKFSESSNETAGEHFTPREVIRLMVNLLFLEDDAALAVPGIIRTLYDLACGTGGMLSVAEEYLRELKAPSLVFGGSPESVFVVDLGSNS